MQTKLLEIRDRATMIIALAIDMQHDNEVQAWALKRYGYPCDGRPNIMITHATGQRRASNDPFFWDDRTWTEAHHYIIEHWPELKDGDVIDVEFILGETAAPKISERFTSTY